MPYRPYFHPNRYPHASTPVFPSPTVALSNRFLGHHPPRTYFLQRPRSPKPTDRLVTPAITTAISNTGPDLQAPSASKKQGYRLTRVAKPVMISGGLSHELFVCGGPCLYSHRLYAGYLHLDCWGGNAMPYRCPLELPPRSPFLPLS